jgi:CHAT domain-containing protein
VPSHDEKGVRRGVDEDKVEKLVQSIPEEYSAKLSPDLDEGEASLMYETEIERVKQLVKQVLIQNMIFAIFAKFCLARAARILLL